MGHAASGLHALGTRAPFLSFIFLPFLPLPAWQYSWAGPSLTHIRPRDFPPLFRFKFRLKFPV
jgi:hypothetical protein